MPYPISRRHFLGGAAGLSIATTLGAQAGAPAIQGFNDTATNTDTAAVWQPVSDRKIKVGLVGYGVCKFAAAFGFQDHPNVHVAAVSDLFEDRRNELARVTRCEKTYPSLEELVKDPEIEAVFVATDAPSHARHCIKVLEHGKHVATAVPAFFGEKDEPDKLYHTVKKTGLTYMMFETSAFHDDTFAMRRLYQQGAFGEITYAEGEYYHYMQPPIDSYKGWRVGLPPQWYPTHSNAYYSCVTGGQFTAVSCIGTRSNIAEFTPRNNPYGNVFSSEVALLKTTTGATARMNVSWDTPGYPGEMGRVRGLLGSMTGVTFDGLQHHDPNTLKKPPLPPGLSAGGHGGSHGYLCNEFITAILEERTPLVDIRLALNMTMAGVRAHKSARRDGEWLKVQTWD